MLLPSTLFAGSQGATCEGPERCHWCSAPCTRRWTHDDPPPTPFQRSSLSALVPGSPWVCLACWMYRRKRVTVTTLAERKQIDGQCLMHHPWLATPEDILVITKDDHDALYETLLFPPLKFCLSLVGRDGKVKNLIQFAAVNDLEKIAADTELHFTLNNHPLSYTIYELEEGLKGGLDGRMPGVRALVDFLGPYRKPGGVEEVKVKRERGRPKRNYEELTEAQKVTRVIRQAS